MQDHGRYTILGRTRDDAAGEAFDKVAKLLGLGYPGGPLIDQLSKRGNKEAVRFPVARFKKGEYDFSFSGIKTAVLNYLKEKEEVNVEDLAAGFQASVVEALIEKTIKAARAFKIADIILGGGVASNTHLRTELTNRARGLGLRVHFPPAHLCTDNGAMIACAGYFLYKRGRESSLSLDAVANLRLNNGEV
jgi:N6-L-threonylcarbamoyladenine synthase